MIRSEVVNHAIEYILEHAKENITVDEVAEYCHFSKFYFSRLFKAETGESVYAFIKRVKMDQSAFRLKIEKERSITDISSDFGYSSSNYSSAFRGQYRVSPSDFRKDSYRRSVECPLFCQAGKEMETFAECDSKITIEMLPEYFVIYERWIGNYGDLKQDWQFFLDKYKDYINEKTLLMELTMDDPMITGEDRCLYEICISADKSCPLENTRILPGGKYAVYHFKGYTREIYAAYQGIHNVWLPQSGCQIDKRYSFEIYRSVDCDTMYMEIDFCIPIK
ncbi:MAG: GyrI-like domain-containing protein [Lachnospiraceae bacterium]|nr:GyrI-like domain-containing protein [Lachnospiraceae bacterium]